MPRITIGLICFNAEQTINRALQSALRQDWPDLEIIVVDDASTDASPEIIERTARVDTRVKLIRHNNNQGAGAARNSVLEHASGEFVAFFDDDDESLPGRIRSQYKTLRAYEISRDVELVACYASGLRRYPNGYELQVTAIGSQPEVPNGDEVAEYLLFNGRKPGVFYGGGTPTCALMARLSTFRMAGNFDSCLRRVEDIDFAVRLALAGGHFIGCPELLYMQHATVAADKTPAKNLEAELRLVEKYADYLKSKKRYGYAQDWFRIRFYHFSGQHTRFVIALMIFLVRNPVNGVKHLLHSVPGRLVHERSMHSKTSSRK